MINETLSELVAYMSPELIASLEKEKEIVGEDLYAYEPGKIEQRTLETLMRYQIEQETHENNFTHAKPLFP